MECQEWAAVGSAHLQEAMQKVRKRANPRLRLLGYVVNKFDSRRKLEEAYKNTLYETYGDKVFRTVIRNSIKYAEASNSKNPITVYMPSSEQADIFRSLAKEVLEYG
jgi:chromosome partitioning protein